MKQKFCSIYKIVNSIDNKVYVGQTWSTLKRRWGQHMAPTASSCKKLKEVLDLYGRDNFKIELIVTTPDKLTADYLEKFWQTTYDSIENGYNMVLGRSTTKGLKLSEERKKKLSLIFIGKKRPEFTDEHKANISKAKMGKKSDLAGKTWKFIDGKRVWFDREII